jgi:hypothetical protein
MPPGRLWASWTEIVPLLLISASTIRVRIVAVRNLLSF